MNQGCFLLILSLNFSSTLAFTSVSFKNSVVHNYNGAKHFHHIRNEKQLHHPYLQMSASQDDDFETASFGLDAVPEDQRPANEYIQLMNQPLFGWASQDVGDSGLAVRLVATYAAFFAIVCYPIAGATYVDDGYLFQKLAAANVGAVCVLLVLLVRLYSGWGFVGSRLNSKVVEYEETGWYDGNFEVKTDAEKARDLFMYRKDVKPVEERLKAASLICGALLVASCVGLNVANSAKPKFNQYDSQLLKVLQADDKLAGVAAQQSNGRPTYCESRYYRAVANGGQGCN